jgi:hypothetical protein
MSDQEQHTGDRSDRLFKQTDEQERIYAPQQLPDGVDLPAETDIQGSAGVGQRERGAADVGVVPVRPDTSINQPLPVPLVRPDHNDDNEGAHDTTQGRG